MTQFFYIAAFGEGGQAGLHTAALPPDGTAERCHFLSCNGASYLCLSPYGRFLFLANESPVRGGVASYRCETDGHLTLVSKQLADGRQCCHVSLSPDGRFLFASDYQNAQLLAYQIDIETGQLSAPVCVIQHEGRGPHPTRQSSAHIHSAVCAPDGQWLCVADLGLDTLTAYPLTPHGVVDSPRVSPMRPASGPRHLLFHPALPNCAYLVNELACTVTVLDYADGRFTPRQEAPLAENVNEGDTAAALRLSPDGRFLIASVRGADILTVFAVAQDGTLSCRREFACGTVGPRDFNFLPGGRLLACGGEKSGEVAFFAYDPATGDLAPRAARLTNLPRPICIADAIA